VLSGATSGTRGVGSSASAAFKPRSVFGNQRSPTITRPSALSPAEPSKPNGTELDSFDSSSLRPSERVRRRALGGVAITLGLPQLTQNARGSGSASAHQSVNRAAHAKHVKRISRIILQRAQ
jgi:hypothetical protein